MFIIGFNVSSSRTNLINGICFVNSLHLLIPRSILNYKNTSWISYDGRFCLTIQMIIGFNGTSSYTNLINGICFVHSLHLPIPRSNDGRFCLAKQMPVSVLIILINFREIVFADSALLCSVMFIYTDCLSALQQKLFQ